MHEEKIASTTSYSNKVLKLKVKINKIDEALLLTQNNIGTSVQGHTKDLLQIYHTIRPWQWLKVDTKGKLQEQEKHILVLPPENSPNFHSFAFKTAQDSSSIGLSILEPIYTLYLYTLIHFSICKVLLQGVLKFKCA